MTIKTLMTSSALSLLLATSVVAQTSDSTTAPADGASPLAPADSTAPMASDSVMDSAPQSLAEMTVGDLNGTNVVDGNGDSIGRITNVVQGPSEGEAVIGIGGFLGIGRYDVALPLSDLSYNGDERAVSVSLTREQLEAMPEYDSSEAEPLPAETQVSTLINDNPAAGAPATSAPAPSNTAPMTDSPATDAPELNNSDDTMAPTTTD
jgi:hypothetical protein